jgi:hypothetical protein
MLKHHVIKTYGTVEVQLHAFLISTVIKATGQLHTPAVLPPGKQLSISIWTEGWMDPRHGLDVMTQKKNSINSGNRTPLAQPLASQIYY